MADGLISDMVAWLCCHCVTQDVKDVIVSQVLELAIARMVKGSTHGVLIYRYTVGATEQDWHLGYPSEVGFGGSDPKLSSSSYGHTVTPWTHHCQVYLSAQQLRRDILLLRE